MEAVVGEFWGGDVVSDGAGAGGVGEEVAKELDEVLLGLGDVLALVDKAGEVGAIGDDRGP